MKKIRTGNCTGRHQASTSGFNPDVHLFNNELDFYCSNV